MRLAVVADVVDVVVVQFVVVVDRSSSSSLVRGNLTWLYC